MINIRSHPEVEHIFPISASNQITKEYYDWLVGVINEGIVKKAVLKYTDKRFGKYGESYYLISDG